MTSSDAYTQRFLYTLLALTAIQTFLVLMPSGMCQTVSTVPPTGIQITSLVPGKMSFRLSWYLGNSGNSSFTQLAYSTAPGVWLVIATNPSLSGSVEIFTDSEGIALENGTTYAVQIAVGTTAFPDYTKNTPSTQVNVQPSAVDPVATAPTIDAYVALPDKLIVHFSLGSPGITQFDTVYYSTNNGVDWVGTGLTAPDWGGHDGTGGSKGYFEITNETNSPNNLLSPGLYLVKLAATTYASATKLVSLVKPINVPQPGVHIAPGAPVITSVSVGETIFKVNYKLPTSFGTSAFTGVYYSFDNENFILATTEITDENFQIADLNANTYYDVYVVVTTEQFSEAYLYVNEAHFYNQTQLFTDTVRADAPIIEQVNPGNHFLTVNFSLRSPGSSNFVSLYYKVASTWVNSGVLDFTDTQFRLSTVDGVTPLTNLTSYPVELRVTTFDVPEIDYAISSNIVSGTPRASAIRPSKPTISDIFSYDNGNGRTISFYAHLGSNGGSDFTEVLYSTDAGSTYETTGATSDGVILFSNTSAPGGSLQYGNNYPVRIVSQTVAFASGNTESDVIYVWCGSPITPDAPVLIDAQQSGSLVDVQFSLLSYGASFVTLWYSTEDPPENWATLGVGGTNPSSPAAFTLQSDGTSLVTGTYSLYLALTNAQDTQPASAPRSSVLTFAYEAPIVAHRSRNMPLTQTVLLPHDLGNEYCENKNWNKFQKVSKITVHVLAMSLPGLALWKLRVGPMYVLVLALMFWLLSHAMNDLRDKTVTTEYKFATRWELFFQRLSLWLSYGCLIAAPLSLFSGNLRF